MWGRMRCEEAMKAWLVGSSKVDGDCEGLLLEHGVPCLIVAYTPLRSHVYSPFLQTIVVRSGLLHRLMCYTSVC